LAILATLMVWYQFMPGWQILLLPAFVLVAFIASFGIGVWITALNVKYRDFRYVVPFIVQLGLYVSGRLQFEHHPGAVAPRLFAQSDGRGHRWVSLVHSWWRESQLYWLGFWLSLIVADFFLWLGIRQFRKMEKSFADLI
jgi:lipopolysaccharide transport system permease protein